MELPYTCSFEHIAICSMVQKNNDQRDWDRYTGHTPSSQTGPDHAADGAYYLYLEGSLPAQRGDVAM